MRLLETVQPTNVDFVPVEVSIWHDSEEPAAEPVLVAVGSVDCAWCGYGPMRVEVPIGEQELSFCPRCGAEQRLAACDEAADVA